MLDENGLAPKATTVSQAHKDDREIIIDSLTRSFWDDPMYNWLAKQDAYLGARFRKIFEIYWDRFAWPYEQIWTTEDRLGAALWSPPNCWQLGLAEQLAFLPDWLRRCLSCQTKQILIPSIKNQKFIGFFNL